MITRIQLYEALSYSISTRVTMLPYAQTSMLYDVELLTADGIAATQQNLSEEARLMDLKKNSPLQLIVPERFSGSIVSYRS